MNIIAWRKAIVKSRLRPTTKLVLYTLANYMTLDDLSCFPSVAMIMEGSGLSKRAVIEHLQKAAEAGFIEKSTAGFNGQGWRRNKYTASLPSEGGEANDHPNAKVVTLTTEGGYFNDQKAVTQMHTKRPLKRSHKSMSDSFDQFWELYPRKEDRKPALKAFTSILKQKPAELSNIIQGVTAYARAMAATERQYIALATTWLHKERWHNDYAAPGDVPKPGYTQINLNEEWA